MWDSSHKGFIGELKNFLYEGGGKRVQAGGVWDSRTSLIDAPEEPGSTEGQLLLT